MAKRIMVINDTQEILDLFRELLVDAGYEVSLHAYGQREIQEVKHIKPDLIISDFPPLDREQYGWQFVQMLKMTTETAKIPVVVCTTNLRAIQDNQSWMISKGVRVVAKPFDVNELMLEVEALIGKADASRPDVAEGAAPSAAPADAPPPTASEETASSSASDDSASPEISATGP